MFMLYTKRLNKNLWIEERKIGEKERERERLQFIPLTYAFIG